MDLKMMFVLLVNLVFAKEDDIPINPSTLSGLLVVFMLLIFLFAGLCSLSSIQGPSSFTPTPLIIGKEK